MMMTHHHFTVVPQFGRFCPNLPCTTSRSSSGPETVECPNQDTTHLGVVGPPLQRDIEPAI